MSFRPYVEHGWRICRIKEGDKGPRYHKWNYPGFEIPAEQAEHLRCAGLMHAYSGTCAIDIDSLDLARPIFAEHGIDLDALLTAPDSVQIDSGRRGRAKLLYALPEPLYTVQITDAQKVMVFELRCKSRTERTTQDVIPPSIHPKTKKPYQWKYGDPLTGDWRSLPQLPDAVRAMWLKLSGPQERVTPAEKVPAGTSSNPALRAECEQILAEHSPDCDYDTWVKLGMMLEHELGAEGYDLWNQWSAGSDKYPGEAGIDSHWNSFGNSPNPVTIGTFRKARVAQKEMFDDITDEELNDDPFAQAAAEKIAAMKLWTLKDIQERPWPTWIIRDLLPKAELSMVFGPSGSGKSFLVLDMALAVARGVPWVDHDVRQGGVLWLAAEAFGSMKPRSKAYAQANDLTLEDLGALPFYVVEQFNLASEETVATLIEAVKETSLQLVVVDTLAAASGGVNENSGEDMGAILDACRRIHYATGASVLLIHHSGKNTELGARGWSGIKAAVQAELRVDYNPEDGKRSITATKQRDGMDGLAYGFTLVDQMVGMDDRELPINSASVKVLGKLEHAPSVEGDGGGRKPPKNVNERLMWEKFLELQPLSWGQPISRAVLVDGVARAIADVDSLPTVRRSLQKALQALHAAHYIRLAGDLVYPYTEDEQDTSGEEASGAEDLI